MKNCYRRCNNSSLVYLDGPALRATALITFANFLLSQHNDTFVTETIWPIIQNDLGYVQDNWNETTFDLWEELDSFSFFTTAVQHRALREGASLAEALGQSNVASGYTSQAENVLCLLQVISLLAYSADRMNVMNVFSHSGIQQVPIS